MRSLLAWYELPVKITKIPEARLLWKKAAEECDPASHNTDTFLTQFAYAIEGAEVFSEIEFSKAPLDTVLASCERYGGSGLGVNGGGARTVNINACQLKGVGPNILVGENVPYEHGYGGLDGTSAMSEIILSQLLNHLLPLGVVRPHGLILIDKKSGRYSNHQCWGVLLVREQAVRPGHFLHSPRFQPKEAFKKACGNEEWRIKSLYQRIHRHDGQEKYTAMLVRFLRASAKQFAFCRMAGILHGGLSESNMSLDGRWLDVPIAGFIPSGKNWAQQSDFLGEPFELLKFVEESVYNYEKYNQVDLGFQGFFRLYFEEFSKNIRLYCPFLLGLDEDHCQGLVGSSDLHDIAVSFEKVIASGGSEMFKRYPQATDINKLERKIFRIWHDVFMGYACVGSSTTVSGQFWRLLKSLSLSGPSPLKGIYVQSAKRVLLSKYFYLKHLLDIIQAFIANGLAENCQAFIDDQTYLTHWIFQKNNPNLCVIYQSSSIGIIYHIDLDQYQVNLCGRLTMLDTADDLKDFMAAYDGSLTQYEFDFRAYLTQVISGLCLLDGRP